MKQNFKSFTAIVLAVMMVVTLLSGTVTAAEPVDLNLAWPATWQEGTPPEWALTPTDEVKTDTLAAINKAYNDLLDDGYSLGNVASFNGWFNMVVVQFTGGDNTGSPWDARKWGMISAPYPGTAFAVKAKFAENFGQVYATPLSNDFTFTDPTTGLTRTYQMYTTKLVSFEDPVTASNRAESKTIAGTGASSKVMEAIIKAYCESSFVGYTPGIPADTAVSDGEITYQEFFGPYSAGASAQTGRGLDKDFGISYIVANSTSNEAFVITDKMFTAWAAQWEGLDTANPDRFSVTGTPTSNQFIDANDNLRQDFENVTIIIDSETDEISLVSNDNTISDFAVEDGQVFVNGDKIEVLVSEDTDLTAIAPTFTIPEKATVDKASGAAQDFTNPAEYKVTAESGDVRTYTVEIYTDGPATDDEKAAAQVVIDKINLISETVSRSDKQAIEAARTAYQTLRAKEKTLVANLDKLEAAEEALEDLSRERIKVACIGDSITEGAGATNSATNYPSYLQEKLGYDYEVRNFGVSGYTLLKNGDYPYWDRGEYTNSKNFQPDIVILMLGTNDSKSQNWDSYNNEFKPDYTELVNSYKQLTSKPIVYMATSPKVQGDNFGIRDSIVQSEIVPLEKEVAAETDSPVIDIYKFTTELPNIASYYADGVHPNSKGYDAISTHFHDRIVADYNNSEIGKLFADGKEVTIDEASKTFDVSYLKGNETPEITAEGKSEFATVEVTQGDAETPATIKVTSKCGMYINTYTVNFTESELQLGDVDGDGKLSVTDIVKLRSVIMGDATLTEAQRSVANVDNDKDNKLTVADIVSLRALIMND